MPFQPTSDQPRPQTSVTTNDSTLADDVTSDTVTSEDLRRLIDCLRAAVDGELDRVVHHNAQVRSIDVDLEPIPTLDPKPLARLCGVLALHLDLATQWRPSTTLHVLITDLESHTADVRNTTATFPLGAQLPGSPTTELPDPIRHRREHPTAGPEIS